jgi:hypothetical protein
MAGRSEASLPVPAARRPDFESRYRDLGTGKEPPGSTRMQEIASAQLVTSSILVVFHSLTATKWGKLSGRTTRLAPARRPDFEPRHRDLGTGKEQPCSTHMQEIASAKLVTASIPGQFRPLYAAS